MHEEDDWPRRGGGRRGGRRPERGERHEHESWGPPMRGPQPWPTRHGPGARFWMADEPRRRPRVKRGDVRAAALALLAEEPRNGYQIIQEIAARSGGVWQPSPGSVYPALQQLEDEGLIRSSEGGGGTGKVFELTGAGSTHVQQRDADAPAPWEQMSGNVSDQAHELAGTMREVAGAFVQVMRTGSDSQIAEARKLLVATRRDLYRILADGDSQIPTED